MTDSATSIEYRIDVAMPAYFSADPQPPYPVISFLDSNYSFPQLVSIVRILSGIPGSEELPRAFCVGIAYPRPKVPEIGGYRRRDMTPTTDDAYAAKARAENPFYVETEPTSGRAGALLRFMTEQVQGFINERPEISLGHSENLVM